jgi:hypothetical protein
MVEHDKNPEIVGTKSKGTVLKAKGRFLGDKGEKPFKGLHREDSTRTVTQRRLSPFLEERRDGREPSGKRIPSFLRYPRQKGRSKGTEHLVQLDADVIRTPHGGADGLNERKNLLFRERCPRRADRANGAFRAEETVRMHHLSDIVRRDLLSSPLRLLSGMQGGSRSLKRRIRKKCDRIMNDKGTKRASHPSLTK